MKDVYSETHCWSLKRQLMWRTLQQTVRINTERSYSCRFMWDHYQYFSYLKFLFRDNWSESYAEFDIKERGFGVPLPTHSMKLSSKILKWKVKIQMQIQISLKWVYFILFYCFRHASSFRLSLSSGIFSCMKSGMSKCKGYLMFTGRLLN